MKGTRSVHFIVQSQAKVLFSHLFSSPPKSEVFLSDHTPILHSVYFSYWPLPLSYLFRFLFLPHYSYYYSYYQCTFPMRDKYKFVYTVCVCNNLLLVGVVVVVVNTVKSYFQLIMNKHDSVVYYCINKSSVLFCLFLGWHDFLFGLKHFIELLTF